MTNNRYWVFGYYYYYPSGGMNDFLKSFSDLQEAKEFAIEQFNKDFDDCGAVEIYDMKDFTKIYEK